jgi:lysyl-tRNA synthetase class I
MMTDSLRYRRQLAEEWLMASSSWRDNLDDAQAQQLLNWARSYVNNAIAETAVLADDEAEEVIDEAVTAVLRVMRDINNLTPLFSQLDEESARQQLQDFSDDGEKVSLIPLAPETINQILSQRTSWQPADTFEAFYQMLIQQPEAEHAEEEE